MRKKIGLYMNHILREPNIHNGLIMFFQMLKTCTEIQEIKSVIEYSQEGFQYWLKELSDEKVKNFYLEKSRLPEEENSFEEINNLNKLKSFFYSEEHFYKFLTENSFFIFGKGLKRDSSIFEYFKLIQQKFDLIILDDVYSAKQCYDTIAFFSKHLMIFKELRFVGLNEEVNKNEFVYLFDNRENKEEINANFILEKLKEIESANENTK